MADIKSCIKEYVDESRKWKLFPVHSVDGKGRCSCGAPECATGKHPRVKRWNTEATDDIFQLIDWLEQWPTMNIGLATGSVSGVVVLDIDEKEDVSGAESLAGLEAVHGKLPNTLMQITGGRGKHYFFKYPKGVKKIENSTGSNKGIAPGIDVRGDGGYVILPPSNHKSGLKYEWSNWPTAIAEMPEWLLGLVTKKTSSKKLDIATIRKKGFEIPEGSRNDTLFDLMCGMRGKYGLNEEELFEWATEYNNEHSVPPLPSAEVRLLATNVVRRYTTNAEKAVASIEGVNEALDVLDWGYSEKGNAFRYFIANDKDMRYCYPKKCWYIYDGMRWSEHHGGEPMLRMYRQLQVMKREVKEINDEDIQKKAASWVARSNAKKTMVDSIALAQPLMPIPIDTMDADPYDLNCLNGTLNLRTMKFRKHDQKDHITFLAPVEFDPEATAPIWGSHLNKIFNNDICFD
jgi:putative DNA primase/helicase